MDGELDTPIGGEETISQERDYKAEAAAMGWKEDFDGPDKLDPKEFVLRKPLYDEMKKLRRKTKDLENALRTQTQMQQRLVEKERADTLEHYKQAKIEALEEGDARKIIQIDEEIEKLKNTPVQQNQPNQDFLDWVGENDWYQDDEDMQAWADSYGLKKHQANPQKPVSEIYAEISRKVKEVFPHKFTNTKKSAPPAVSTSDTGRVVPKDEEAAIPKEYKQVFHTMWRSGAWGDLTMKEAAKKYAADLKKIGEI